MRSDPSSARRKAAPLIAGVLLVLVVVGAVGILRSASRGNSVPPSRASATAQLSRVAEPVSSAKLPAVEALPDQPSRNRSAASSTENTKATAALELLRGHPELKRFWDDPENSLEFRSHSSVLGGEHIAFAYFHAGIEVIGGQATVHEVGGRVSYSLELPELVLSPAPVLPVASILQQAVMDFRAGGLLSAAASRDPVLRILPASAPAEPSRLVYLVKTAPEVPAAFSLLYDAQTGVLIAKIPNRR